MADENEDDTNTTDEEAEKLSFIAKNKKLILLILLGLLLIGVSVGGTLAALTLLNPPETTTTEGEEGGANGEGEAPEPLKQAIYFPLKPPIMVSYDARGRQRLMQAEITLLMRDNDVVAAIETHMPMVRNALVLLMSGKTYEEVQTAEGKELLRVESLQTLRDILEKEMGKPGVEQVLFTNLILQ